MSEEKKYPKWAEHRHMDCRPLDGNCEMIRMFLPQNGREHVGHAIIVWQNVLDDKGELAGWTECLLLHIEIQERYRGMELAKNLITGLKTKFDKIITGPSTKPGRNLCLSCGFKLVKGMHKRDMPYLVWEREDAEKN